MGAWESRESRLTRRIPQGVPHEILPDHEEAQPFDPHHAARGSGHLAQGVREVRVRTGEEPVIRRYATPFQRSQTAPSSGILNRAARRAVRVEHMG